MPVTRRELLSVLLGATLGEQACQRRFRQVAGQLVGARIEAGHRLIDARWEQAAGPVERTSVAIVGAGPSGLAAAWQLERHGIRDYRVLDLEPRSGGTSASGRSSVSAYPWGAHYVPLPAPEQRELITLLEQLGAVTVRAGLAEASETARIRAPEERLFIDGTWTEGLFPAARASAVDFAELARFQSMVRTWATARDGSGRRAFTLPLRRCSDDAEFTALDRISAARWLTEQNFRSPLLRWYVEYACRDDYGASLERVSAWAMLFYFCARLNGGGSASGGASSSKKSPGTSLQPSFEPAPFLTWPEGNGRVVEHLARQVGDRLWLDRLVTDVAADAEGVNLAVHHPDGKALARLRADDVILAVPKLVARRILRDLPASTLGSFGEFAYAPWLVANLHLHKRPRFRGFQLAWDNVLFDSPALGYVVATHQTLADWGPSVFTYYRPFWEQEEKAARAALRDLDHASAAHAVLTDLTRAHLDLEDCVERIDIMRWGHGMVTPRPGFLWGAARRAAAQSFGRVAFAHSDLSGLPLLEEALDRGIQAADAVARRRGRETPGPG